VFRLVLNIYKPAFGVSGFLISLQVDHLEGFRISLLSSPKLKQVVGHHKPSCCFIRHLGSDPAYLRMVRGPPSFTTFRPSVRHLGTDPAYLRMVRGPRSFTAIQSILSAKDDIVVTTQYLEEKQNQTRLKSKEWLVTYYSRVEVKTTFKIY